MKSTLSILTLILLWITVSGQKISDFQRLDLNQGFLEREMNFVERDAFGYFYFFFPSGIQRYDGSKVVDVDISSMKSYTNKTDKLIDVFLDSKGRVVLNFENNKDLYYIESGKLKLTKHLVSQFSGEEFRISEQDNNVILHKLHGKRLNYFYFDDEEQRLKTIDLPLSSTQSNVKQLGFIPETNTTLIRDNFDQVLEFKNDQLKKLGEGKFKQRDDVFYIILRDNIIRFKNGESKNFNFNSYSYFPAFFNIDRNGDLIVFYGTDRALYTYQIIQINGDSVFENNTYFDLTNNDAFTDVYADYLNDKIFISSHNGLYYFRYTMDGVSSYTIDPNAESADFGKLISSCDYAENYGLLYFRETSGIHLYVNGATKSLFEKETREGIFDVNSAAKHIKGPEFVNLSNNNDQTLIKWINLDKNIVESDIINGYYLSDAIVDTLSNTAYLFGDRSDQAAVCIYKNQKFIKCIQLNIPSFKTALYDPRTESYIIGTEKGCYHLNRDFENVRKVDFETSDKHLLDTHIGDLTVFNNYLVIGTRYHGLLILDRTSFKLQRIIDKTNGLSDNHVISIISHKNHLWLGTFNGINVLNEDFQIVKKIFDFDGLATKEMYTEAISASEDEVYFGSNNGISVLNSQEILSACNTGGVGINSVLTKQDEEPIAIPFKRYLNLRKSEHAFIQLDFPDYMNRGNIVQSYKILINGNEVSHSDSKTVELEGLKIGENRIRINTVDGLYGEEFIINIKKDYRILWSVLGILVLGSFITYFTIRFLNRRNLTRQRIQVEQDKKMNRLKLTALQAQMNPHFIFNALGAVQYFIQVNESDKADTYLTNFARLIRQILESSKSEKVEIRDEIEMLKLYCGLEKTRFDDKFDYFFVVDEKISLQAEIPPMVIQPFIENAINHGLYHLTSRLGVLKVAFKQVSHTTLKCIIEDNGIGREKAKQYVRKKHKSRGMQIVAERIQSLKYQDKPMITIDIEDLKESGQSQGTRVVIHFVIE